MITAFAVLQYNVVRNVVAVDGEPDATLSKALTEAYPGAALVSLAGVTPQPQIGWSRVGGAWQPPALVTAQPGVVPAPSLTGPADGTERLATLDDEDPLTLRLDDGTTYVAPQVVRHAGYSPVKGDSVEAVWRNGAWIVRDAVVAGSGA